MKTIWKIFLGIPIVIGLVAIGYWGYSTYLTPLPATQTPTIVPADGEFERKVISAEGKVVPHQFVRLSFGAPGTVEEVLVTQGQLVQAGDPLAVLKGREELEAALTAANLELTAAQKDLDALYEHIELAAAQAQMNLVDARENVADAQNVIEALNVTASQGQIGAADAAIIVAERELERARDVLDAISDRPENAARRATAELAVYAAERAYYRAISYRNALTGSPNETEVARAEANLALAEAQLYEKEKEYAILSEGPDPDEVDLAQARLDNAQAQLSAVQTRLQNLELRAAIAGEIVSLNLKSGEVVNPAQTQVVLADLSSWKIETTDLTEKDVALLSPGMQATITLNAFPDQVIQGEIEAIALFGEERRGSVTYMIRLNFDAGELPVRWEMTAFIDILLP